MLRASHVCRSPCTFQPHGGAPTHEAAFGFPLPEYLIMVCGLYWGTYGKEDSRGGSACCNTAFTSVYISFQLSLSVALETQISQSRVTPYVLDLPILEIINAPT